MAGGEAHQRAWGLWVGGAGRVEGRGAHEALVLQLLGEVLQSLHVPVACGPACTASSFCGTTVDGGGGQGGLERSKVTKLAGK